MPRHKALRHLPTLSQRQQLQALFRSTALADLQHVLAPTPERGARSGYPPLLSYAVAVAARVCRSQNQTLATLNDPGAWADLTDLYRRRLGVDAPLPSRPPTARQQDRFVAQLVAQPGLLEELSEQFTLSAVGQARAQGNFPEGVTPDFANPDTRHLVFGDGTFYAPFSRVVMHTDVTTGDPIFVGSRSRHNRPRYQSAVTTASADGKSVRGLNHLSLSTWTDSGWVVLANGQARGAEVHVAEELIDRIHARLGKSLHTVVWDRAVTGWRISDLLATKNIMVLNKHAARSGGSRYGYTPPPLSDEQAGYQFEQGQALPLGISVYRTTDGLEVIQSPFHPFETKAYAECSHELWVDDGALVDVQERSGRLVKVEYATATTAHTVPLPQGNTLKIDWRLPCPASPCGLHEFVTSWTPRREKHQALSPWERALEDLRPVSRQDERFPEMHGLRNITESYNSWVKARLGTHGRAMRLDPRAQFLDHLCAGTLANALSAARHAALAAARAA